MHKVKTATLLLRSHLILRQQRTQQQIVQVKIRHQTLLPVPIQLNSRRTPQRGPVAYLQQLIPLVILPQTPQILHLNQTLHQQLTLLILLIRFQTIIAAALIQLVL